MWQWALAVPIIEANELEVLALHQAGQIVITPTADGSVLIWAAYRPRLATSDIAEFHRFDVERVYTFLKNGPQAGLWFKRRSDDGWQVTMTIRSGVRDVPGAPTPPYAPRPASAGREVTLTVEQRRQVAAVAVRGQQRQRPVAAARQSGLLLRPADAGRGAVRLHRRRPEAVVSERRIEWSW